MKFQTLDDDRTCETVGLIKQTGYELSASVTDSLLIEDCREFLEFVANYLLAGNPLRAGETLMYGYWLTKAQLDDKRRMFFQEYNPEATEFVFGVSHTIRYWKEQHDICEKGKAIFSPPRPDQKIVISEGVYEGDEVEGVRYPSPNHMSGWWITTDRYNGNVESLKTVHAHHVSAKRPDLAKFLALPFGYRFVSKNDDVWFDEAVVNSKN
jgi:hypothetical protein